MKAAFNEPFLFACKKYIAFQHRYNDMPAPFLRVALPKSFQQAGDVPAQLYYPVFMSNCKYKQ